MSHAWFWPALFFLGCYHGINPAMGWLFAVALGLQEKSLRAVFLALPPITLGHLLSVFGIVALAALAQATLPESTLKYGAALILIGFGLYRGIRARHPRWVGMRVGFSGLIVWAFLMATGHGAGLMLLPFLTGSTGVQRLENSSHMQMLSHGMQTTHTLASPASLAFGPWLLAVGIHTLGYVLVMTFIAWVVFQKVGLHVLRTAWFNFDLLWALALVFSGVFMLLW